MGFRHQWLQDAMLEHIRIASSVYNLNSRCIISNQDIDELIISKLSTSILDRMLYSDKDVAYVSGYNVLPAGSYPINVIRHHHHTCFWNKNIVHSKKYLFCSKALSFDAELTTHEIRFLKTTPLHSYTDIYLHHMGISNNWKYPRNNIFAVDGNENEYSSFTADSIFERLSAMGFLG